MYGNQNQYQQQNGFQQSQQAASPVGTSHQGEITGIEAQQQTDFQTGVPLFYPNGNPKPQVVIHLKTGLRDPKRNYDDGVRAFYCKGYSIPNLRAASQQAGVGNFPRVGDTIRITFSETKPSQTRGFADAKICAAGDAGPPAEGHRQDPPGHRGHDGHHPGTGACRRAIVAAGRPTAGTEVLTGSNVTAT